ncbi:hypothetical protein SCLCIDRAFT_105332 [Scleroderma citrinum Foug A]|uniref:Spo12-like protein n=1 Tax=Scleroderma citrinum Foug A TaxID=1036808 RepID=A0A0C3E700_9AGAM|nr:hypothetical protein SCLCIDRAFT_105332 [Scleroderma citrinum Foug A]
MSATSTPNESPAQIQPMHNPSQAAHIVLPQALANATNGELGAKALLAKRMAKGNNPKFVSPTDNFVTPVTQKLNAAKQMRFTKGVKPIGNLGSKQPQASDDVGSESDTETIDFPKETKTVKPVDEDENPF